MSVGNKGIPARLCHPVNSTDLFAGYVSIKDNTIFVVNATEATIIVSVETDYWNEDASPAQLDCLVSSRVANAQRRGVSQLQERHVADFRNYFDRTSLSLGPRTASSSEDTNQRYASFNSTGDLGLVVNLFQFGRYLYISSSRPGSLPPNLVGIWNNNNDPAWAGSYTTDLNVEMFHWQSDLVGLSDLQQPLYDFTPRRVIPNGERTAKILYNRSGWVAHTNNDLWGDTAPWYKCVGFSVPLRSVDVFDHLLTVLPAVERPGPFGPLAVLGLWLKLSSIIASLEIRTS